jgi:hypothetical protein
MSTGDDGVDWDSGERRERASLTKQANRGQQGERAATHHLQVLASGDSGQLWVEQAPNNIPAGLVRVAAQVQARPFRRQMRL